ncbi:hypothetical protein RUND412_006527 [Rhizina undulata]
MCSRVLKACIPSEEIESPLRTPVREVTLTTCPNCGYKVRTSSTTGIPANDSVGEKQPSKLPPSVTATLLLNHSPSPQLLLADNNTILYANKAASQLLSTTIGGSGIMSPSSVIGKDAGGPILDNREEPRFSIVSDGSYLSRPEAGAGLEGRNLEDLSIELARKDIRKWISLVQVLENVKNGLRKIYTRRRHSAGAYGTADYSEFYYSRQDDYDIYGEEEDRHEEHGDGDKHGAKESIPVIITKRNGKLVKAALYVSVLDRDFSNTGAGDAYTALCIVPQSDDDYENAGSVVSFDKKRTKSSGRKSFELPEVGRLGVSIVERVATLKDLILQEMDYAFLCLTPDGDIVITNKALQTALGAENLQASVGEGFDWISRLDIYRPDFSERLPFEEWALNKIITDKRPVTQTIGLYSGSTPLVLDLKGKPLWENPEKEEGLLAALAVVVDQTEWAKKQIEVVKKGEMKRIFLMNVSRELKTPIAGIIGLLELLHDVGVNSEQKPLIRQIFSSVNSLLLVVNDLIDFNKIEAGELRVDKKPFVLQELVEDIRTLFTESMSKDGVEFEIETSGIIKSAFEDGKRLFLRADDGKIRRVLINMLSNAFKFTSRGKVILKVETVQVDRKSLSSRFEVTDTGAGISDENVGKLFQPLDQAFGSNMITRHTGTGFGLAIAKSFTDLLNGDIGCTSVLGEGSTFWFSVPCARLQPGTEVAFSRKKDTLSELMGLVIRPDELEDSIKSDWETKNETVKIEGLNVMIVEDNWSHQVVTERRLQKMGCNVFVAVNGQDAINKLTCENLEIDVIFMDLQMPLLDGYEATSIIRKAEDPALEPYKKVPIIAVTATMMEGDQERLREVGMNDFTLKPLHNDTLRLLIETQLGGPVDKSKERFGSWSPVYSPFGTIGSPLGSPVRSESMKMRSPHGSGNLSVTSLGSRRQSHAPVMRSEDTKK